MPCASRRARNSRSGSWPRIDGSSQVRHCREHFPPARHRRSPWLDGVASTMRKSRGINAFRGQRTQPRHRDHGYLTSRGQVQHRTCAHQEGHAHDSLTVDRRRRGRSADRGAAPGRSQRIRPPCRQDHRAGACPRDCRAHPGRRQSRAHPYLSDYRAAPCRWDRRTARHGESRTAGFITRARAGGAVAYVHAPGSGRCRQAPMTTVC